MDYVIILTHTELDYDSRIRRQILNLSKNYNLIVGCQRGDKDLSDQFPNVTFVYYDKNISYFGSVLLKAILSRDEILTNEIKRFAKNLDMDMSTLRIYENYRADYTYLYTALYYLINNNTFTVKAIIANDVAILPMAYRLRSALISRYPTIKLWGDMHEIHFNYINEVDNLNQQIRNWICDMYLPHCNHISSVSDWGVRLYSERYPRLPIIPIRNVASYVDILPSFNEKCRLVHVGVAGKERKLGVMIDCLSRLSADFTLDLYLVAVTEVQERYIEELDQQAMELQVSDRVTIHKPIKSEDLIVTINTYDIGLFLFEPVIQNQIYALPNKLFEFIQARLAVVTSPVKSMKETIEHYDVGKVSEDYSLESYVNTIKAVRDNLTYYKEQSDIAAKELNVEKEWKPLIDYINR